MTYPSTDSCEEFYFINLETALWPAVPSDPSLLDSVLPEEKMALWPSYPQHTIDTEINQFIHRVPKTFPWRCFELRVYTQNSSISLFFYHLWQDGNSVMGDG